MATGRSGERQVASSRTPEPALRRLDRPPPLSQLAYERIRELLFPGDGAARLERLVERDLGQQLSMSRTPVRDALRRLALAGLVEPAPGGGYVPRRVSLRDVREYYDLRILLEPHAAALAAGRPLGEAEPDLPSQQAVSSRTPQANMRFHRAIALASGNAVLAEVIGALNERLASQRIFAQGRDASGDELAQGHAAVVAAIRRRDAQGALATMREHLSLARELLIQELRQVGDRRD